MKEKKKEKIVVALSGGVDSAVAALLLKDAGHEVIGVTLRLAPDADPDMPERTGRCCSIDDLSDARRACDAIGIPFHAIDAQKRFYDAVFRPFVDSYKRGITPIPCVACNHEVKFGDLFQTAKRLGAKLATGHYAKVVDYRGQKTFARPTDRARDQTYYLYGTPKETVENLILPLGELSKPRVREIAKDAGLLVYNKKDSQEICFVPDGDHAKVVEKALGKLPKGDIVDCADNHLGTHEGVHHFTIGQRRGLKVSSGSRLYVADIDAQQQKVVLGDEQSLLCKTIELSQFQNLIKVTDWPEVISVQIRARHKPALARIKLVDALNQKMQLEFVEPVQSVALGQAGCVYDGEILLGGGTIRARLDGRFPRSIA